LIVFHLSSISVLINSKSSFHGKMADPTGKTLICGHGSEWVNNEGNAVFSQLNPVHMCPLL
jgi:hypothetical protein